MFFLLLSQEHLNMMMSSPNISTAQNLRVFVICTAGVVVACVDWNSYRQAVPGCEHLDSRRSCSCEFLDILINHLQKVISDLQKEVLAALNLLHVGNSFANFSWFQTLVSVMAMIMPTIHIHSGFHSLMDSSSPNTYNKVM